MEIHGTKPSQTDADYNTRRSGVASERFGRSAKKPYNVVSDLYSVTKMAQMAPIQVLPKADLVSIFRHFIYSNR